MKGDYMTIADVANKMAELQIKLDLLSTIAPENYDQYNELRLKYDSVALELQVCQLQLSAIDTSLAINERMAISTETLSENH